MAIISILTIDFLVDLSSIARSPLKITLHVILFLNSDRLVNNPNSSSYLTCSTG
jgi:hypothetical protein